MKNEPAYPVIHSEDDYAEHLGLTKREHFAAMAMQGILSNHTGVERLYKQALKENPEGASKETINQRLGS